jgi:dihydropteroate synthase
LAERAERAERAGIPRELICVDPGIGFGKTAEHNLTLIRHLDAVVALGYPVLVGVSRKRFLSAVTGAPEDRRGPASVAASVACARRGAWMVRVHDVRPVRDALAVEHAIEAAP